ncbi:hypothetical protein [Streptomyces sp. NPDC020298]|uniref:hypothetical protein n=1 Tax=unclassified Streptomyces TaxID=2593676 RepID=UPI0033EC1149
MAVRKRPGRVRTKRSNGRTPLLLSTIAPQDINLREGETRSIVCPDCRTWRRLMGETQLKIREHCHSDRILEGQKHDRCPGSGQVVQLDISVDQWAEAMAAADSTTTGRRSARQHYKPLPAPAKAVTQMTPVPVNAADALTAYREHLKMCRASTAAGRCDGTHRCADGARLAALYAQLKRIQPLRDREARVDALLARYRSAMVWAKHSEATANARATAKRGGTTVEETNNACRIHPADAVSEFRGPQVPLAPVHISA